MDGERVVSLRFRQGNMADKELYRRLEEEKARQGISMPALVKKILSDCLAADSRGAVSGVVKNGNAEDMEGFLDRIRDAVREEMSSLTAVYMGASALMPSVAPDGIGENMGTARPDADAENLPGYSDELPEGFEDVLEKMLT